MKDRALKYSEESVRLIMKDLKREFETQLSDLQHKHDEALDKWNDSNLKAALEAAYLEEIEQLKLKFNDKAKEVQDEVNSLLKAGSNHITSLQSKIKDLFRYINQSTISLGAVLFLRTKDLF